MESSVSRHTYKFTGTWHVDLRASLYLTRVRLKTAKSYEDHHINEASISNETILGQQDRVSKSHSFWPTKIDSEKESLVPFSRVGVGILHQGTRLDLFGGRGRG